LGSTLKVQLEMDLGAKEYQRVEASVRSQNCMLICWMVNMQEVERKQRYAVKYAETIVNVDLSFQPPS